MFMRPLAMAASRSRQALRRWGNSLAIRLPAAIAKEAHLEEDQAGAAPSFAGAAAGGL